MSTEVGRVELERLLTLERRFSKEGLTFDDVLLVPGESNVLPDEVSTTTRLTRTIELAIPICSAAMDTVTEARMAIALAREGGIGIIHRNLSIDEQLAEVDKVKRSESGMIVEPVTLGPDDPVASALALMETYHISGVPITDESGKLVGILTNRDLRFEADTAQPIAHLMTREGLVTVPVGTTLDEAREVLHRHKIEKLPVVDVHGFLKGLITVKDIQKRIQYPLATKDEKGRLRVGAAIGAGADALERAEALVGAEVDVLVIDTSHGHSRGVIDTVRRVRDRFDVQIVAGNIATGGGRRSAHRRRSRCCEGRHRTWFDLHHTRRCRSRGASDHGDPRLRAGRVPAWSARDRRRRNPAVGRCRQGDRGGRRVCHARKSPGRNRRESR